MISRAVAVLHRGVESAIVASVPQVIVPKLEERLVFGLGTALLYGEGPRDGEER